MLVVSSAPKVPPPSCVLPYISDKDRHTSLYIASQNSHHKVVKFLVEKGRNVNAIGEFSSETSASILCAQHSSPKSQTWTDTEIKVHRKTKCACRCFCFTTAGAHLVCNFIGLV
jgi:ankyrin repeat protein